MSRIDGHDSRTAEKIFVRTKPEQRERLRIRAQAENRSMNDAMVTALDRYLDQGEAFDEMLRIINQAIKPQGGAFVTIRRDYLRDLVRAVMDADEEGLAQHSEAMVAALAVLGGEL